jgi:hypothetical protein
MLKSVPRLLTEPVYKSFSTLTLPALLEQTERTLFFISAIINSLTFPFLKSGLLHHPRRMEDSVAPVLP